MERPILTPEQKAILEELEKELKGWKIPGTTTRPKKSTGYGRSVAFGFIRKRALAPGDSRYNLLKPKIWELLQMFGKTIDIPWKSVQINQDVVCGKHKDKGNIGSSYLVSFGPYTGGELVIEGTPYDCNMKPIIFDGKAYEHWNNEFTGSKWTIVFFEPEIPVRFRGLKGPESL